MAYITHKRIKGNSYYYAEESEWKDGRARRKWQKYLGPLTKIIAALEGEGEKPRYAEIFQLGGPAACWRVAEEHQLVSILERILPKRRQGLSVGFYLMLAAMNRAIAPASKRSMWRLLRSRCGLRARFFCAGFLKRPKRR